MEVLDTGKKKQLLLGASLGIGVIVIGIVVSSILIFGGKRQEAKDTSGEIEKLIAEDDNPDGNVAFEEPAGAGSKEKAPGDEVQGLIGSAEEATTAGETLSGNRLETFLEESPKGNWKVYFEEEEAYGFQIRFRYNHTKEEYYDWSRSIEKLLWNEEETKVAIVYRTDSKRIDYNIMELKRDSYLNYGKSFFYSGLFNNGIAWSMEAYNMPVAWEDQDCLKAEFQCFDLQGELYQGTYTINTKDDSIIDYHFSQYPTKPLKLEDKLGDVVATSWELYENQEYPLLAETKDKGVRLYDIKEGDWGNLLIKKGDLIQMLPWIALSPRYVLPRIYEADLDNDGMKEVICILHTGTGTGVSIDELHVLETGKDGYYIDKIFEPEDYIVQMEELVKGEYDSKNRQIIIKIGDASTKLPDEMKDYAFERLCFGNFISYDYEEKTNSLRMQIGVEGVYKELPPPQYLTEVEAKLIYKEEDFHIQNPTIIETVE